MTPGIASSIGLATIEGAQGNVPAIRFAPQSGNLRVMGIVAIMPVGVAIQTGVIEIGSGYEASLADVPGNVILDRIVVRGQANNWTRRGLQFNGHTTAVIDSWVDEIGEPGADTQAIAGWTGPGPFKIVNNYLAAAGENIMFGGDVGSFPVTPSDIEIRRNHLHKPNSYRGKWVVKNVFELKTAARVLMEDCVLSGSWQSGQDGYAIVLKASAFTGTSDITIRRILIERVGAGFTLMGIQGAAGGTTRRVLIEDVTLDISESGSNRAILMVKDGPEVIEDVTVRRMLVTSSRLTAVWISGEQSASRMAMIDVGSPRGEYGVLGDGMGPGAGAWNRDVAAPRVWSNVYLIGVPNGTYPPGTTFVSSESAIHFAASIRQTVQQAIAGVVVP